MKYRFILFLWLPVLCIVFLMMGFKKDPKPFQVMDNPATFKHVRPLEGFGVNINPALWNNGSLKPAIDYLVDELGCTIFRFDCFGQANWLDPSKRDANGKYSDTYLTQVYTSKVFEDSWNTFRYLNTKGVQTFFSVSGKTPTAFGSNNTLSDYTGYAEMVVTMLDWARNKEGLTFSLFSPFNETDFGAPEGPKIINGSITTAIQAVITKLQEHGLNDIKLDVMDDLNIAQNNLDRISLILNSASVSPFISKFGFHTYWTPEELNLSMSDWWATKTGYGKVYDNIKKSSYQNCSVWMSEFGHNELTAPEWDFLWFSTKRLLKALKENFNAGIYWDAFDNYHKHDAAWTTYGLLYTDTVHWTYTPKKRFYALKQVYRYVKPAYEMVSLVPNYSNHTYLLSFVSTDRTNFTIVGMSETGADAQLNINLDSLDVQAYGKKVFLYRTSQNENCSKIQEITQNNKSLTIPLLANSIFTLTTDTTKLTADTSIPSVPTGLAPGIITQTGVTLSWNASIDNVGVIDYDIYTNGVLVTSVPQTSATIIGLTKGTSYSITVKARDAAGNVSDASNPIQVTTQINTGTPAIDANSILIYPNPANNWIDIKVEEHSTISIEDVDGKILLSKTIDQGITRVQLLLKSGIYFIKISGLLTKGYVNKLIIK